MSLLNFSESSVNQLRALLGTYGNEKIGRILKSSSSYVESRWFEVTEKVVVTVLGGDDTIEYRAQEVRIDGSVVENGIVFDTSGINTYNPDDPVYYKNLLINSALFTGDVEVGKAYQVESTTTSSYEEETQYYIIPKGGGGDSYYRLRCNSDTTIGRDTSNTFFDLVDELNNIITPNVAVTQSRFNSAFFYVDEVIYAIDSDVATYSVDPFIFGVGG